MTPERPTSATDPRVAALGLLALLASVAAIRAYRPFERTADLALVVMAATALGVFVPDLAWRRIYARCLQAPGAGDPGRSLTKLAGLLGVLGLVALLYWALPEYAFTDSFYRHYWTLLQRLLPPWLLLALPYIHWIDRRMAEPYDGLWQMGRLVTLHWDDVRAPVLAQFLAGWIVKGFFLPLMFTYLCNDLERMLGYRLGALATFRDWYDFLYFALYFVDVALVSMTYLMSLRLTDTHLRSTEPTALGWLVALVCYQPFWSLINRQYIAYDSGTNWGAWFGGLPVAYALWGTGILVLTAIYVWATVVFGGRFSNLTHRGIITAGPYRYTKHPAYVAKNLSWWMVSMPFMVGSSVGQSARHCLLLLALNGIYFLRAKTEERHLGADPEYVQYARWIDAHGLLRFVNAVPVLGGLARWQLQPLARTIRA